MNRVFAMCLAGSLVGCATQLELDPKFAPQAQEVAMQVPGGFFPPEHFVLAQYQVSEVAVDTDAGFTLGLGPVETSFGGNWRMRGKLKGPEGTAGSFECVGPSDPWHSEDKVVHVSFGQARLGCNIHDGKRTWAMLFDVVFKGPGPEVPDWVAILQGMRDEEVDPREFQAVLLSDDGQRLLVDWAHQTVRVGNVGGYYVLDDAKIVGAVDVTYMGAPRAYLSRDLPSELRPSIVATLATVYLLTSLR